MTSSLSCFKAYDIRGRVPGELTLELVRQTGLAFAELIAPKDDCISDAPLPTVCLGYDMRLSSLDIARVLTNALEDGGLNVVDIGLCGTEEMYHAVFSQNLDGGIMITASHNPADWNGMKLVRAGAVPIGSETGIFTIRDRIAEGDLPTARRRGVTRRQSFRKEYAALLLSCLGDVSALAPLRIVANAGNGCAWPVMEELLPHLPCQCIPLHPEPDGTFPNGVPNPLLPENRSETSRAVVEQAADFGIAWDGDFDRCFFFDEKGRFIEGYYLVGLLARTLLENTPGAVILHDTSLVWNTRELVAEAGGLPLECRNGHAFFKERMRREDALYGGEMSGHHYFREFGYCDSGMLSWLLIYRLLSTTGLPLSALVDEVMRRYPVSGEINRKVADAGAVMDKVKARFAGKAVATSHTDGLSMDMGDWRFSLRSSNTEPLLRLNVESRGDVDLMQNMRDEILSMMV